MISSIPIVFACDDGYAKHVAVVMQSIFANAGMTDRHEFHILTLGLSVDAELRLAALAQKGGATMEIHRLNARQFEGFPTAVLPLETYLRLSIPELFPDRDKIIYLDADLIVMDSLAPLWDFSLGDLAVGAAIDTISILKGEAILQHFQSLNLPEKHIYFNAGVLLLNLKVLRELKLLEITKEWAEKNSALMINSDQDALNVLLVGNVEYFPLRWNIQASLFAPVKLGWKCSQEHIAAVSDPAIVHYVTHRKPWRKEFKLPYQNLYFKYLADTPWQDETSEPLAMGLLWHRGLEELEWMRKLIMSKLRILLGRRFVLSNDDRPHDLLQH